MSRVRVAAIAAIGLLTCGFKPYGTNDLVNLTTSGVYASADGFRLNYRIFVPDIPESATNGVPLVLFPQTPEQDAVAKRTEELGAGVRLKSISEEDVLDALTKVISEPQYKEGAVRVSESFKACGGASEAKEFLEQVADRS